MSRAKHDAAAHPRKRASARWGLIEQGALVPGSPFRDQCWYAEINGCPLWVRAEWTGSKSTPTRWSVTSRVGAMGCQLCYCATLDEAQFEAERFARAFKRGAVRALNAATQSDRSAASGDAT